MPSDEAEPLPETRRLILVNATEADLNFAVLAEPGSLDGVSEMPPPRMLAWKVAFVPGQSEAISSHHHFVWAERQAFVLGRLGRGETPTFLPEAVLPIPDGLGRTYVVGFVGTIRNGAPKLLRSESGNSHVASLHTDGSFPSSRERAGMTGDMVFALAVDPDPDGAGAASIMPLEPNRMATLSRAPRYWIIPVRPDVLAGETLSQDIVASAYRLDFDAAVTLRLTFTDRNVFVPTES